MSTRVFDQNGVRVTQCANGAGLGTRLEIIVDHDPAIINAISPAVELALALLQWVANERGQKVTLGVEPTRRPAVKKPI